MNIIRKSWLIWRHLGTAWVAFRLAHTVRMKAGVIRRRTSSRPWTSFTAGLDHPSAGSRLWTNPLPTAHSLRRVEVRETPVADNGIFLTEACGACPSDRPRPSSSLTEAEEMLSGTFTLFSKHEVAAGFPPDWHRNPLTGEQSPTGVHWSSLGDFAFGDIKNIWELSRFSWAFTLARAFARNRDERYAEAFWTLLEDWMKSNQPYQGVNWKCGQEAAIRLLGATFARFALADARATTPVRIQQWEQLVLATAFRIEANLDYALSQSNNHGISECVGLVTAAMLCPGCPQANRWRQLGLKNLQNQVASLIYVDGGFAQHSTNYHRLMLQVLLWLVALMRANGAEPPAEVLERARLASSFIEALVDPVSGKTPRWGSNDGAWILPLEDLGYEDYRPLVQLGHGLLNGTRRFPPGLWDEPCLWLCPGAMETPAEGRRQKAEGRTVSPDSLRRSLREGGSPPLPISDLRSPICELWSAPTAGLYRLEGLETCLFFRGIDGFKHRPAQCDLANVDVWWKGRNVACDPGSYSYNAKGQFSEAFKSSRVHNTLTVDGLDPMEKVSKFLLVPWPHSETIVASDGREIVHSSGGYARLGVCHTRSVSHIGSDRWEIREAIESDRSHSYLVQWLFADADFHFDGEGRSLLLNYPEGRWQVTWSLELSSLSFGLETTTPRRVRARGLQDPSRSARFFRPGAPTGRTTGQALRASVVRGDPASDRGWVSRWYQHVEPAVSLWLEWQGDARSQLVTSMGPSRN